MSIRNGYKNKTNNSSAECRNALETSGSDGKTRRGIESEERTSVVVVSGSRESQLGLSQ